MNMHLRSVVDLGRTPHMDFSTGSQVQLSFSQKFIEDGNQKEIWGDTLIIPSYLMGLSILILTVWSTYASKTIQTLFRRRERLQFAGEEEEEVNPLEGSTQSSGTESRFHLHVAQHGGGCIYAFKVARFIGCLLLFCLSIASSFPNGHALSNNRTYPSTTKGWLNLSLCLFYFYASLLSAASITSSKTLGNKAWSHTSFLLLGASGVYIYRDIYPLVTFTLSPMDKEEGRILWAKIAILFFVGAFISFWIPHQYIPVDPKRPMQVPNPEQTASYASSFFYLHLTPLIWFTHTTPRIQSDDLPPLCDYDHTAYLKKKSFPEIDTYSGAKKRYLLWGLLKTLAREYVIMILAVTTEIIFDFAFPLSINRILNYIETPDNDIVVRPWFWVLLLFVAPAIASVANQWYYFITVRVLTRLASILTQLIFEHALRIRMKADAQAKSTGSVETLAPVPTSGPQEHDRETLIDQGLHTAESTLQDETLSQTSEPVKESVEASKQPGGQPGDNLIGKLNNLVTTDVTNITEARDFILAIVHIPLQITFCIVFLYVILGWSAFVGLAVMVITFPIPGYLASKVQSIQDERLKRTDSRVQIVTETMNVIRMIKLFGWERSTSDKISAKREEELVWIWKREVLEILSAIVNFSIPLLNMAATYTTYVRTLIMKQELSASKIFSSMAVFDRLRDNLWRTFYYIMNAIAGKVSLDRVDDFLHNASKTELIDTFTKQGAHTTDTWVNTIPDSSAIGFSDATFTWTNEISSGTLTPSKRDFRLKIKDQLLFKRGCINLIIGPTGSGKTSLLMALLGEMHVIPNGPQSWSNLPREKGISYATQESWVQNETIRDNILFGSPYDETRYKQVLYQCALEPDLALFEAGDATEVGEKGLTLSGGQKARLTLARAIYSSAEIILLDDVLAALDVHTAKWIVDKCFKGNLIRDRTILLVTHNVAMTRPVARFCVTMDINGTVASTEDIPESLIQVTEVLPGRLEDIAPPEIVTDEAASPKTKETSAGRLILAEEAEEGHVSWESFKLLFDGLAGNYGAIFFISLLIVSLLCELLISLQTWYLGYWASQYEDHPASEVNPVYYLSFYGLILLAVVVLHAISRLVYVYGSLRASRAIHNQLIKAILGTTFRWLDTTPVSRIIARCTQDIRSVDGPLAEQVRTVFDVTVSMFVKFAAILWFTPIFIIPGAIIGSIGRWVGNIYIIAQLPIKRELSNAKAPVIGHFGAAIAGIVSIRAYGVQDRFIRESMRRIDRSIRAERIFYTVNRWVTVRIDTLGSAFAGCLAVYLVYFSNQSAANIGFSLNMAAGLSVMILWWIRFVNLVEVEGNSLERIKHYIEAKQEVGPSSAGIPPAHWPSSGQLVAENLSARYSDDGPEVLHKLNFKIASGERIGVVGRTGSGKSTLSLSLLRTIHTEGDVYYDNMNINSLNLDALRSKITIIPQVPELLRGTLRHNLDPFDENDDAVLNDALRAAGLFDLQIDLDENRLTLDSEISGGGNNLSVGQRQIIALSRAIVRGSKLLILDEATSAIDYKTDAIIQSSLRNELKGDVTIITIAHRLQTIMDADRIMVLDAGNIVEFDSPKSLLYIEGGKFRALVDESSDKAKLYEVAGLVA